MSKESYSDGCCIYCCHGISRKLWRCNDRRWDCSRNIGSRHEELFWKRLTWYWVWPWVPELSSISTRQLYIEICPVPTFFGSQIELVDVCSCIGAVYNCLNLQCKFYSSSLWLSKGREVNFWRYLCRWRHYLDGRLIPSTTRWRKGSSGIPNWPWPLDSGKNILLPNSSLSQTVVWSICATL